MALNKTRMRLLLEKMEDNSNTPYYDGKGLVTVGVGFNIEDKIDLRNALFVRMGLAEFTGSPSPDGKPLTTLLPCFNVD